MRAILHIDGDAFFAYCEVAQNERLRGRPVVTGEERGIAIAVSYEAKARGVSRGMLMGDVRKLVPDVVIIPGHYDLYEICARRMYSIVRRHSPVVEEYSIDECFGDLTGVSGSWDNLVAIAHRIKDELERDLGMTFSLGLAPTKTLAKVASKCKKPAGFTAMQEGDIRAFLQDLPIGKVWGIGSATSAKLVGLGVLTALQFVDQKREWVEERFAKPVREIWYELQGIPMHRVGEGRLEPHKSIRATRTFRPPSNDLNFILSELARNAENACCKLRHHGLAATSVYFFLKTQTFMHFGKEIRFEHSVSTPPEIMNEVKLNIFSVYRKDRTYRASGIVLQRTVPASLGQQDLFGFAERPKKFGLIYETMDALGRKLGEAPVMLASALASVKRRRGKDMHRPLAFGEIALRLGIPSWGDAT